MLPCVVFEDEHLLVVNKPAGWNTHAPSPHAGQGLYDWLRHREPRWSQLAIVHRLDKETSGVLVFGKSTLANRSLTQQFTERRVHKRYVFLTQGTPSKAEWTMRNFLARAGERYTSSARPAEGDEAETRFRTVSQNGLLTLIAAEPRTGRTHQIRVHASDSGVPVLGDTLYGGAPYARVCLHAQSLSFTHPATGEAMTFETPAAFDADTRLALRSAMIESDRTHAYRLLHGAADHHPGWYVDRLGDFLLSQSAHELEAIQRTTLEQWVDALGARGAYHKHLSRQVRRTAPAEARPQWVMGAAAPGPFQVRENELTFELSFNEGYSVGLFLDQRDNRRRVLTGHIAAGFEWLPDAFRRSPANPAAAAPLRTPPCAPRVLNVFAYTCAFSVCAAKAGAHVTSLDLSRKYLDWGRRNFAWNGLDPAGHDFIYGDAFDWLGRLAKKGRRFDLVLLDPPTFSQSKQSGVFKAEKDYARLVRAAAVLLQPGGILFASTNAAGWEPAAFGQSVRTGLGMEGRHAVQEFYAPQPPDFPVSRSEPAYLKTLWMRLDGGAPFTTSQR